MEECARLNCDKPAVALLTFAPQQAKAWLYDLDSPDPTGGIMLCRKHANATVVPMSWQLVDARDPAWPGPASEQPEAPAASVEPVGQPAATLPSDSTVHDGEFAGLRGDLPVTPQPYAEPRVATLRAAGVLTEVEERVELTEADMSLFQLPLSDSPAVTPHPDYR
ncbi:MAG: DUF3499 family protein [Actinomycetota bacterium]